MDILCIFHVLIEIDTLLYSVLTLTLCPSLPVSRSAFLSTDRFSRPSIGGRARPGARTTASPEPAVEPAVEEEIAPAKEVKPVSSGFARGRRKLP